MKTIGTWIMSLSCLTLVGQACGQDDGSKLRNDPTYSTQNYKHPNKAAAARRWASDSGISVKRPVSAQTNVANYKRQVPNQEPVGGVTVAHTPSTDVADRNYKIQRPVQSNTSGSSAVAGKKKKRPANGTAIGD